MLHKLFPQLADMLRAAMPDLGTVDLDMAQLDYQDRDVIAYPAVFIDLENIPWEDRGSSIQTGKALLRFTVAVEVSEDTTQGSSQRTDAMERLVVVQDVHRALQHQQGEGFGPLVRVSYRRDRPQHPEAWCLAMGYVTQLYDNDASPELESIIGAGMSATPGTRPPAIPDDAPYVIPT